MRSGSEGREVAMKVYEELRRIGGVQPPREFVLMDRAAIGLGSVFMHLKAEVNWHRLFEGLIDNFDSNALAQRQREAAIKAGIPEGDLYPCRSGLIRAPNTAEKANKKAASRRLFRYEEKVQAF